MPAVRASQFVNGPQNFHLTSTFGSSLDGLALRDYQREAVVAALDCLEDRERVHVLDMPTGSGKTPVGVALASSLLDRGHNILWICKGWQPLAQAADAFSAALPQYRHALRRLGRGIAAVRHLAEGRGGRVYLITLSTWHARRRKLPTEIRPTKVAVIWDEVHWASHSLLGLALREQYLGRAPVYGLSATPVVRAQVHIAYHKPPDELWGSVLARPLVRVLATGTEWCPAVLSDDFAPQSLRALGTIEARNRLIVDELIGGMQDGRYTRSLLFACSIEHAVTLARMLSERGIAARAVPSQQRRQEQEKAVQLFRDGRISALLNVGILIEGFDLPQIDAVFLTRPTRSRLLLTRVSANTSRTVLCQYLPNSGGL